jgi:hypothetical protein
MLIDSDVKVNTISFVKFTKMMKEAVWYISQTETAARKLFPYDAHFVLDVVRVFNADVTVSIGM